MCCPAENNKRNSNGLHYKHQLFAIKTITKCLYVLSLGTISVGYNSLLVLIGQITSHQQNSTHYQYSPTETIIISITAETVPIITVKFDEISVMLSIVLNRVIRLNETFLLNNEDFNHFNASNRDLFEIMFANYSTTTNLQHIWISCISIIQNRVD